MSKRSSFDKIPRDYYPTTDPKAVPQAFIDEVRGKTYAEPCCGAGDLVDLLMEVAVCRWESDIESRGAGKLWDAMCLSKQELARCDLIISNPPYTKGVLLPMIDHFISLKPTWLLLPADMMHNLYFGDYIKRCSKVISVGRICWFPREGKRVASTDNYAWYYWKYKATDDTTTEFVGRT